MTTIAEDLLLLLTNDRGGNNLMLADATVAGALLAELAGREHVALDDRGRISLVDSASVGDPLLDEALLRFGDRVGTRPKAAIQKAGKGLAKQAYEQLARAELVEPVDRRALGLSFGTRFVPMDGGRVAATRAELVDVLSGRREPDLRTGTLISLLRATGQLGRGLPAESRGGLTMREIKGSAKDVSQGRWASEAVLKAVQDVNAALVATIAAGGAANSG